MNEWLKFGFIFFGILSVLGASELIRKKFKKPPESTRQFIHICVGIVVSICPFIFKVNYQLITLSLLFIAINTYLISANKVSSMNNIERVSYGTIYFPLSVLLLASFFWDKPISYFLSILVLTFADPAAAAVGKRSNNSFYPWKDKKSINGSLAMFSITFIIILFGTDIMANFFEAAFYLSLPIIICLSLFIALCATLSELISYRGSDNLTVPLITFFSYEIFLINYTHGNLIHLFLWTVLSVIIFNYAYKKNSVSLSGAIGGFLIGIMVFGSGGWLWISPLIFFFISSSILSHLRGKSRSKRDIMQILANGGVPTFFALFYFFFPSTISLLGYLGSLSAATADTWATEIGFFSKSKPKLVFSFKAVEKGSSGAISILGSLGSAMGSFCIAIIAALLFEFYYLIIPLTLAGIIGAFFDSMLGRFIQAKYRCNICQCITEEKIHCNESTELVSGLNWMDNNFVNFVNTLLGAIIIININFFYG